jgi:ferritin-like metal-binding protein YciE
MKIKTMEELFVDELKDLYDAEKQIIKALPKMAKAASSEDLREAFQEHLDVTKRQVERLETIFSKLDDKPSGKKCAGMQGLIEEGQELISEGDESPVLDAGLIAAAQKVEHYEIAGYGTARTHAELLGNREAARLLEQTLQEEKRTDEKLTELAENLVNQEAAETEEAD